MADISDVEKALVSLIGGLVYPLGVGGASAMGAPCAIERGWPNQIALSAALAAGNVVVSVYSQANIERVTTRFRADWQQIAAPATTLTATLAGATVTFGGTIAANGQVALVQIADTVYTHTVGATDTLASIAASFAAVIPGAKSIGGDLILSATVATAANTSTTYFNAPGIVANVSGTGSIAREIRRQERGFHVIVWAPTPTLRDAAASLIDSGLAAITLLTMPDGFAANVKYERTNITDANQNANLYRRDLFYLVEYATTQTLPGYSVAALQIGTPPLSPAAPINAP